MQHPMPFLPRNSSARRLAYYIASECRNVSSLMPYMIVIDANDNSAAVTASGDNCRDASGLRDIATMHCDNPCKAC
jgi:hypothetical protein